ncbi:Arginase [Echinococcus granulosus]|uniref:Arginase n=1 Tax=Echinococcus granulosus TaxID=6210 RepID=W6U9T8_ECHGR|nr:Arginase [Echinococcus granulosus]EUB58138.1 Arginase [Echinococcus granulosus]
MSHCGRSSFTDGRIMTWGQPEDRVQNGWKVIREQSPMELLRNTVAKGVSENDMRLTLGGGHRLGIWPIAGQLRTFSTSFVVWVDTHADINNLESLVSRHTHGMLLSFLLTTANTLILQT